jgi:hypothetical protein
MQASDSEFKVNNKSSPRSVALGIYARLSMTAGCWRRVAWGTTSQDHHPSQELCPVPETEQLGYEIGRAVREHARLLGCEPQGLTQYLVLRSTHLTLTSGL